MSGSPAAEEDGRPSPATAPSSGGVEIGDIRDSTISVAGDIVGRDKITAETYIARQVIITTAAAREIEEQPPEPGEPPYKGLQYFDAGDADLFFGRERLTAELVGRISRHPFLAVVGASGSGKSSLLRAGVVPALRRGERLADGSLSPTNSARWLSRVVAPTARPFAALAAALSPAGAPVTAVHELAAALTSSPDMLGTAITQALARAESPHLLLIVDQFEELFTLCREEATRRAYVDALLEATATTDNVTGVLVLRADFYGEALRYDNLRQQLERHQAPIGPMSREEMFRAIAEPAARGGWQIQEGLVELVLDEVGDEPGALPLLSHALLETWARRRGRTLTLSGYTEAGRVQGAIARTADAVYQSFDPTRQTVARYIFLSLTELGQGTQDTRRRANMADLAPARIEPEMVAAVVKKLADSRLITTGQEGVEVAHEALIRAWPRLRGWLDEDRDSLRLHRQLAEDAAEWAAGGKDAGLLYRGARLTAVEEWRKQHASEMTGPERAFVAASLAERAQREAERREQQRREEQLVIERQTAARLRRLRNGLTALAALLVVVVGYALAQRSSALAEADARATQERLALAEAAGRATQEAIANRNAALAGTEAALAGQARGTAEAAEATTAANAGALATAQAAALTAQERAARAIRSGQLAAESRLALAESPGEALLLAIEAVQLTERAGEPRVAAAEEALRETLASLGGTTLFDHDGAARHVVSDDGRWLATFGGDEIVRLWDLSAPETPPILFESHEQEPLRAAISAGNRWLATGAIGELRIWAVTEPAEPSVILPLEGPGSSPAIQQQDPLLPTALAFSPDGRWLVYGRSDGQVQLWDSQNPDDEAQTLAFGLNSVTELVFAGNGRWLAAGGWNGQIQVWDWTTPAAAPVVIQAFERPVHSLAISPDGRWLAAGSSDATARLWSLATLDAEPTILAHEEGETLHELAFDPAAERLAAGTDSGNVYLWDLSGGSTEPERLIHVGQIMAMRFSPDGQQLAVGQFNEGPFWLWQLDERRLNLLSGPGNASSNISLSFAQDGRLLISSRGGTTRRWDLTGGLIADPQILEPVVQDVIELLFLPDSRRLLALKAGGITWLDRAEPESFLVNLYDGSLGMSAMALSPDGRWLASGNVEGAVRLWDLETPTFAASRLLEREPAEIATIATLAFSPDGRWLAATSSQGTPSLWQVVDGAATPVVLPGQLADGVTQALAFSRDGRWLALAGGSRQPAMLQLLDLRAATLDQPLILQPQTELAGDEYIWLAFSPDGAWLAAAAFDAGVYLWPVTTAALAAGPQPLVLQEGRRVQEKELVPVPSGLQFSQRGRWLAVQFHFPGGGVHLWDISRIEDDQAAGLQPVLLGDRSLFDALLDFTPDEQLLATVGTNNALHLWRLGSGDPVVITPHDLFSFGRAGDVSPDGRWLAVAGGDIRLWRLDIDELLELGCEVAGRSFRLDEWEASFPGEPYRPTCPIER